MEAATLEKLETLILRASENDQLDYTTPAIILGNQQVQSLEHLQAGRSRFRGAFRTSVLADYVKYLQGIAGETRHQVFVDPERMHAKTFLNLGTLEDPGHADWVAELKLQATAPYAALLKVNGERHSQRDLAEWLEDWSEHIEGLANDEAPMAMKSVVSTVRDINMSTKAQVAHNVQDYGASRSALEEIEFKSGNRTLPWRLRFTAEPYLGFKSCQVLLRLSVITGERPALCLRICNLEALQARLADELQAKLAQDLPQTAALLCGAFTP